MSKECYCVSIYVISSKSKMISEFFFLFIFCVQKFTYHESRTLPYLYYISYLLPFYKLTILDLLYNLNIYRIGRGVVWLSLGQQMHKCKMFQWRNHCMKSPWNDFGERGTPPPPISLKSFL